MVTDLVVLGQRLDELAYDGSAADLVRFVEDDLDVEFVEIVQDLVAIGEVDRRTLLPEDSSALGELRIYAERRTLGALVNSSLDLALQALDARLVVPDHNENQWSRDLAYTLFVARSLGATVDTATTRADEIGGARLVEGVSSVLDVLTRVEDLRDVGRVEVDTSYGLGILELEMPTPKFQTGWYHAPSLLKANSVGYDAQTNLAATATHLADGIEEHTNYVVYPFEVTVLPDSLLVGLEPGTVVPCEACLLLNVFDDEDGTDVAECYVAELADDETVAAILDGIESVTDGSIEVAGLGRQIVLIAAIPSFDGEEYLADDLTPVRELARLALIETETESG